MSLSVHVENVSQRFGETTALNQLSFSLEAGKIYGLLGRNGSGKSTLLSIIGAFRKPTDGLVRIDNEPVFENAAMMRQICLIRESGDTVEDRDKVADAIGFASGMRPNWDSEYAGQLTERLGLNTRKKIRDLSRGQRSALGVVLGLAARAPLTMFDESYLGMDAPARYIFYDELLADFIRHPRTLIISTHLIEEVSSLFEEVVIIDRGKLLVHEETDRLLARGVSVTGSTEMVDRFTDGLTVLNAKQLGPTKSAMVFGSLDNSRLRDAEAADLDIGPVALQDMFVHLTGSAEVSK
jgi:ABC-2 type transport system ATP-binding protein